MSHVLDQLTALLRLERIEENLFRGQSQDPGWGRGFGGQVLGQALSAAEQTVPEGRTVHSFHGYFLRPGDAQKPIVYDVERIRDGRGFTTRRVVAIQDGRPIYSMGSSFQADEPGYDHQDPMPLDVPAPEALTSELELARANADRIPLMMRAQAVADRPIEIRAVEPFNVLRPKVAEPRARYWYRAAGSLPDEPHLHQYLLAYASDFQFLGTSLRPHGRSWLSPGMHVASLDHAMWFHRPFRFDDWLLYVIDSPSASGARGLVRGQFFTRDGVLVASTAQEGLIRPPAG